METKINIAEILKDKPVELKLYSSTFGYIKFNCVYKNKVYFSSEDTNVHSVKSNGKMYDSGECIIFPSKEMRNWNKFAWKKGDVLMSDNGKVEVIFEKFVDDTYQSFIGKHHLDNLEDNLYYQNEGEYLTSIFNTESKDAAQIYVKTLEKKLGGKLNRETLEVEKAQPKFKDGDVVALDTRYINSDDVIVESFIVRGDYKYGDDLKFYAACSNNKETDVVYNSSIIINKTSIRKESLRLATEEEKQQLFDALSKEGKAWDAKKKQIVDLKPKCKFKPFDKVLVRDYNYSVWKVSLFGYKSPNNNYYYCCNGSSWIYCIPYEGNEHLLGTTNNVED